MAVYQGARPGRLTAPHPGLGGIARGGIARGGVARHGGAGRRSARPAIRAGRSRIPVGAALGAITLVFFLAFFSLAQTISVSASNYEVDRLAVERERLQERQQELLSDINRLGGESATRKLAFDAGLGQLDAPIILPVR
jgi:hypothetical protein